MVSAPHPTTRRSCSRHVGSSTTTLELDQDVMDVLAFNQCSTSCRDDVVCCRHARVGTGRLRPSFRRSATSHDHAADMARSAILVVNPTCSMMLRHEYPEACPNGVPTTRPRSLHRCVTYLGGPLRTQEGRDAQHGLPIHAQRHRGLSPQWPPPRPRHRLPRT